MQQATCKTLRINAYCSLAVALPPSINNSQHISAPTTVPVPYEYELEP